MPDETFKLALGGDVQASDGTYIERLADNQLFEQCLKSQFSYVLACRQIGKSSLRNSVATRLLKEEISVVQIDLNLIGQTNDAEKWYFSLIDQMVLELRLSNFDLDSWWDEQSAHQTWSLRLVRFFETVVLKIIETPVIVFIDEIDMTLNLPFSDDFFTTIRSLHNLRSQNSSFQRLTFVLLGVATPDELIKNNKRTPFNIGHAITMRDFTIDECEPLKSVIEKHHPGKGFDYISQIYDWSQGHPYLTQKLCSEIIRETPSNEFNLVDKCVDKIFFSKDRVEDNLRFVEDRLLNDPQPQSVLRTYKKILNKNGVIDDEKSIPINRIKLYGLAISRDGVLQVRNKLYNNYFDSEWVETSLDRLAPLIRIEYAKDMLFEGNVKFGKDELGITYSVKKYSFINRFSVIFNAILTALLTFLLASTVMMALSSDSSLVEIILDFVQFNSTIE